MAAYTVQVREHREVINASAVQMFTQLWNRDGIDAHLLEFRPNKVVFFQRQESIKQIIHVVYCEVPGLGYLTVYFMC